MRTLQYAVPPEEDGITIKTFLRRRGFSARQMNRLKYSGTGGIYIEGGLCYVTLKLRAGQILTVELPPDKKCAVPTGAVVPVVYQDSDIIVFNKPAGMPCHPVKKHQLNTLAGAFATLFPDEGYAFRPVGRLDMNTSGLVVAAMNAHTANSLVGRMEKRYLCVAAGDVDDNGEIEAAIAPCPDSFVKQRISPDGAPAKTLYKTLCRAGGLSLVLATPLTGRTHQIRVHMAHAGWPLLGDTLYGDLAGDSRVGRQALHCAFLTMRHPCTNQTIGLSARPPEDFSNLLNSFCQPFDKISCGGTHG